MTRLDRCSVPASAVVVLVLVSTVACAGDDGWLTAPDFSAAAQALPMDTVATEFTSGFGDRGRHLIINRSDWEAFWLHMHKGQHPTPEVPAINFEENVVVAAAMGGRVIGGYTIGIEEVARNADPLFAKVHETSPGDSCIVTQGLTQPIQVVRVPVSDVNVLVTIERDSTHDCD